MTRALVTGAQGFTARYLIPTLNEAGWNVAGLLRPDLPESDCFGAAETHTADLRDADAIKAIVEQVQPDAVFHLAGIAHVAHADVREMYETNILGTRNLLQALADAPRQPSSVLLASSANVYGNLHEGRLDEDASTRPINDYGVTKLATEHLAKIYMDRLPVTVVRPFNYTGIGQSSDFIIPKIVDHARRKAPTIELGNLDVARDFSDVRSVVQCYARLVTSPDASGKTFNICSGKPYALSHIIECVEQLTGHKFEIRTNSAFVRRTDAKLLYGDNRRLMSTIGTVAMLPLEATLQWMIEG